MYVCLVMSLSTISFFFFFNDTATTEIYTLSLHDALPIFESDRLQLHGRRGSGDLHTSASVARSDSRRADRRSEEHTSELQSQSNLVCRLLLEKKKKKHKNKTNNSIRARKYK